MNSASIASVASIVEDAGGRVVGRTRLQKVGYLLSAAGFKTGFNFVYKHYGPYSEELASASRFAGVIGLLDEAVTPTQWGGSFSTYVTKIRSSTTTDERQLGLARAAAAADAIELELAATALFLSKEGFPEPWKETERRKPEKAANGRLARARELYARLRQLPMPDAFPAI